MKCGGWSASRWRWRCWPRAATPRSRKARRAVESGQGCSSAWLRGAPTPPPDGAAGQVVFSGTLGLVAVADYPGVTTPQGVRIGSGVADTRAAYPNRESATDPGTDGGRGYAPVPGNDEAVYRIEVTDGKVISLTLQHKQQDCYE